MNGKNNKTYAEDQVCEALKEISPEKLAEIKKEAKEIGYGSVIDYLLNARELYKALYNENKKGIVLHLLIREHGILEKIIVDMGENDRIIKFNIRGIEYNTNGKKTPEYT